MSGTTLSLAINGRFLCQHITGVQRYAHELVFALDGLLDWRHDIEVTVISPPLHGPMPLGETSSCSSQGSSGGMLGSSSNFRVCPREKSCFAQATRRRLLRCLDGNAP